MDFPWISHGFPTGHMRRGGRGLIDTALRQNVHVFHGLKRKGKRKRESHGGSSTGWFYTWVTGGLYYIMGQILVYCNGEMIWNNEDLWGSTFSYGFILYRGYDDG